MAKQKTEDWWEAVLAWRRLTPEERYRRHLESIPRSVANSMAIEGEPVDEQWIREQLAAQLKQPGK